MKNTYNLAKPLHLLKCGNSPKAPDVKIEPIVFPAPKISFAVKAKNSTDDEKVILILNDLAKIDPTLVVEQSKELRQLIVSGQGELHLSIIVTGKQIGRAHV